MQRMMWKSGIATIVVLLFVVVAVEVQTWQSKTELVRQPGYWVAVSYARQSFNGDQPAGPKVRVFRGTDGSVRHEQPSPPFAANARAGFDGVFIENHTTGRMDRRIGTDKWISSPLTNKALTGKPNGVLAKSRATQLSASDPRISAIARTYPQLTFWEFTGSAGNTVVFCPELNMLDVYSDAHGMVNRVVDVVLGEPDSGLFALPVGVEVEERPEPDDIGQNPTRRPVKFKNKNKK
jgi:hypothetical protein